MKFNIKNGEIEMVPLPGYDLMSEILNQIQPYIRDHIASSWNTETMKMVLDNISVYDIAAQINHNEIASQVATYFSRELVSQVISNDRFQNRLMRHINEQTVGLVNDAVERVVAIIESKQKQSSDVDY